MRVEYLRTPVRLSSYLGDSSTGGESPIFFLFILTFLLNNLRILFQKHQRIHPCDKSNGNGNVVSGWSNDIIPSMPDYPELAVHQSHYVVPGNSYLATSWSNKTW